MRLLIAIFLTAFLAMPVLAADATNKTENDEAKTESAAAQKAGESKAVTEKPQAQDAAETESTDKSSEPTEYTSPYYTVTVPKGWKAVIPPTGEQGTTNAIFSKNPGNATVTLIIGPNGGASAKSIAQMFAEQFKSPKPPVEKNGRFSFSFPQNGGTATAYVGTEGKEFVVTVFSGNEKEGMQFIRENVKSDTHAALLGK